jgi:hypothetical protein
MMSGREVTESTVDRQQWADWRFSSGVLIVDGEALMMKRSDYSDCIYGIGGRRREGL